MKLQLLFSASIVYLTAILFVYHCAIAIATINIVSYNTDSTYAQKNYQLDLHGKAEEQFSNALADTADPLTSNNGNMPIAQNNDGFELHNGENNETPIKKKKNGKFGIKKLYKNMLNKMNQKGKKCDDAVAGNAGINHDTAVSSNVDGGTAIPSATTHSIIHDEMYEEIEEKHNKKKNTAPPSSETKITSNSRSMSMREGKGGWFSSKNRKKRHEKDVRKTQSDRYDINDRHILSEMNENEDSLHAGIKNPLSCFGLKMKNKKQDSNNDEDINHQAGNMIMIENEIQGRKAAKFGDVKIIDREKDSSILHSHRAMSTREGKKGLFSGKDTNKKNEKDVRKTQSEGYDINDRHILSEILEKDQHTSAAKTNPLSCFGMKTKNKKDNNINNAKVIDQTVKSNDEIQSSKSSKCGDADIMDREEDPSSFYSHQSMSMREGNDGFFSNKDTKSKFEKDVRQTQSNRYDINGRDILSEVCEMEQRRQQVGKSLLSCFGLKNKERQENDIKNGEPAIQKGNMEKTDNELQDRKAVKSGNIEGIHIEDPSSMHSQRSVFMRDYGGFLSDKDEIKRNEKDVRKTQSSRYEIDDPHMRSEIRDMDQRSPGEEKSPLSCFGYKNKRNKDDNINIGQVIGHTESIRKTDNEEHHEIAKICDEEKDPSSLLMVETHDEEQRSSAGIKNPLSCFGLNMKNKKVNSMNNGGIIAQTENIIKTNNEAEHFGDAEITVAAEDSSSSHSHLPISTSDDGYNSTNDAKKRSGKHERSFRKSRLSRYDTRYPFSISHSNGLRPYKPHPLKYKKCRCELSKKRRIDNSKENEEVINPQGITVEPMLLEIELTPKAENDREAAIESDASEMTDKSNKECMNEGTEKNDVPIEMIENAERTVKVDAEPTFKNDNEIDDSTQSDDAKVIDNRVNIINPEIEEVTITSEINPCEKDDVSTSDVNGDFSLFHADEVIDSHDSEELIKDFTDQLNLELLMADLNNERDSYEQKLDTATNTKTDAMKSHFLISFPRNTKTNLKLTIRQNESNQSSKSKKLSIKVANNENHQRLYTALKNYLFHKYKKLKRSKKFQPLMLWLEKLWIRIKEQISKLVTRLFHYSGE